MDIRPSEDAMNVSPIPPAPSGLVPSHCSPCIVSSPHPRTNQPWIESTYKKELGKLQKAKFEFSVCQQLFT